MNKLQLQAVPIDPVSYKHYGSILEAPNTVKGESANYGTALKYSHIAEFKNLRGECANSNLSLYRCNRQGAKPFPIKLLERHPESTQIFVPMHCASRYVVVVALGKSEPEMHTLKAFIVDGAKGISYHPGTWHHPMIAWSTAIDFISLIWESDRTDDARNCEEFPLIQEVELIVPG